MIVTKHSKLSEWINTVQCGDCLELMKELPDNSIDLTITSPPYNMRTRIRDGKYTTRERSEHFSKKYSKFDDAMSIDDYYEFHKRVLVEMLRISRMVFWNVSIVTGSKEAIFKIIGDFSKDIKDVIIWDKGFGQPAMHNSVINRGYEFIIIFENGAMAGRAFKWSNFERGTMPDVWKIQRGNQIKGHNACFPVDLPARVINNWGYYDSIIFDPFCGSGTTLVAAKQLGCRYIGFDIVENYVDISRKRLAETGISTKEDRMLAGVPLTFEDIL